MKCINIYNNYDKNIFEFNGFCLENVQKEQYIINQKKFVT